MKLQGNEVANTAFRRHPMFARGFTLIELMVVVVIIGLISAIAIPSYSRYVVRSNRSAAQSYMLAVANKQEQVILDQREYATAANSAAFATGFLNLAVPSDVSRYYDMSITNVGANVRTYLITATPIIGKTQAGDGALTLDNLGTKSPADKW